MSQRSPDQKIIAKIQKFPTKPSLSLPLWVALPGCVPRLLQEVSQHPFVPKTALPQAASCHTSDDGDSRGGAQLQSRCPFMGVTEPQNSSSFPALQRRHPGTSLVPRAWCGFHHHPPLPAGKGPWVSPVSLPWRVPRVTAHLWGAFPACTVLPAVPKPVRPQKRRGEHGDSLGGARIMFGTSIMKLFSNQNDSMKQGRAMQQVVPPRQLPGSPCPHSWGHPGVHHSNGYRHQASV